MGSNQTFAMDHRGWKTIMRGIGTNVWLCALFQTLEVKSRIKAKFQSFPLSSGRLHCVAYPIARFIPGKRAAPFIA